MQFIAASDLLNGRCLMSVRTCKDCQRELPLNRDHFGSTPSGGFRYQCRKCMREHVKNYDNANADRRQAAINRAMRRTDAAFSANERARYRQLLIRRDGSTCFYCRTSLTHDFHIDHKTPVVKGGARHDIDNLALSCVQCNQEKHNKNIDEYRDWRRKNRLDVLF